MGNDNLGNIQILRRRLGLDPNDDSHDLSINTMPIIKRIKLITGWCIDNPDWVNAFCDWCESQNIILVDKEGLEDIKEFIRTNDNETLDVKIYNRMLNIFKEIL